jgi:hypothetical protein
MFHILKRYQFVDNVSKSKFKKRFFHEEYDKKIKAKVSKISIFSIVQYRMPCLNWQKYCGNHSSTALIVLLKINNDTIYRHVVSKCLGIFIIMISIIH